MTLEQVIVVAAWALLSVLALVLMVAWIWDAFDANRRRSLNDWLDNTEELTKARHAWYRQLDTRPSPWESWDEEDSEERHEPRGLGQSETVPRRNDPRF